MKIIYKSPNEIFSSNKRFNRDNINYPYFFLKKFFKKKNIHLVKFGRRNDLSIHFFHVCKLDSRVNYLILPELEIIYPLNNYIEFIKYDKVFTILDDYKNKKKFIKIHWPVFFPKINKSLYFSDINRKFLCNISSNKYSKIYSDSCLYDFRYKDIKWFEDNDVCFDLYGYDWHLIKRNNNLINKIIFHCQKYLSKYINFSVNKSFKGVVKKKNLVLKKYKFCLCYENYKSRKGYITEKIFDCFFSGTIPVYFGAQNINKYVPDSCFIDRRRFKSTKELNFFLKNLETKEILIYKKNIYKFLKSKKSKIFSYKNFVKTIYKNIKIPNKIDFK